jgi:hypothetical protein
MLEIADIIGIISLPKIYAKDILQNLKNKDKIFRVVEKDLLKTDKNRLIEEFKPEILK